MDLKKKERMRGSEEAYLRFYVDVGVVLYAGLLGFGDRKRGCVTLSIDTRTLLQVEDVVARL